MLSKFRFISKISHVNIIISQKAYVILFVTMFLYVQNVRLVKHYFFFGRILFSSDARRRSTFLISSPADIFSGTIPRSRSILRTARLLSICSRSMLATPCKSFCWTLTLVISAAKSFALMPRVGKKSAKARFSGAPSLRLSIEVFMRKRAWSPLLRMIPNPLSSTPRS